MKIDVFQTLCKVLNMRCGPIKIMLKDGINMGEQTCKDANLKSNDERGALTITTPFVCFAILMIVHCILMTISEENANRYLNMKFLFSIHSTRFYSFSDITSGSYVLARNSELPLHDPCFI